MGALLGVLIGLSTWTAFKLHYFSIPAVDSDAIAIQIEMMEGKLALILDKVDEAIDEIEPPTIAEHLASIGRTWFENKMMRDQAELFSGTFIGPQPPEVESWPDVEPAQSEPASVPKNQ